MENPKSGQSETETRLSKTALESVMRPSPTKCDLNGFEYNIAAWHSPQGLHYVFKQSREARSRLLLPCLTSDHSPLWTEKLIQYFPKLHSYNQYLCCRGSQSHNKFFLVISCWVMNSQTRRSKLLCLGKRSRTSPWQLQSVSVIFSRGMSSCKCMSV